jgi:hypothetical protein
MQPTMSRWGSLADITGLLSRVGLTLLLLGGIRLLTVAFPFQLLQPPWWIGMARELINISPVLLTGTTVLLVTSRLANVDNPYAMERWGRERRLLRWVAYLYALLIPVQIGATVLFDRDVNIRQTQQLQAVQRQLSLAQGSQAGDMRNLRIQQLQAMQAGLLAQRRKSNHRRFSQGMESLRVCGSAAVVVWLLLVAFRREPW